MKNIDTLVLAYALKYMIGNDGCKGSIHEHAKALVSITIQQITT